MCAEWQNTLPPQLLMISTAGACSTFTFGTLHAMKLLPKVGRVSRRGHLYLRRDVAESPFGPLPEPPLLLCVPGKVATGKPSALRAETHRTPDLSVVLETHQLYSRLISCTRRIST